jgi:hypothetical protein
LHWARPARRGRPALGSAAIDTERHAGIGKRRDLRRAELDEATARVELRIRKKLGRVERSTGGDAGILQRGHQRDLPCAAVHAPGGRRAHRDVRGRPRARWASSAS